MRCADSESQDKNLIGLLDRFAKMADSCDLVDSIITHVYFYISDTFALAVVCWFEAIQCMCFKIGMIGVMCNASVAISTAVIKLKIHGTRISCIKILRCAQCSRAHTVIFTSILLAFILPIMYASILESFIHIRL